MSSYFFNTLYNHAELTPAATPATGNIAPVIANPPANIALKVAAAIPVVADKDIAETVSLILL